jgi:hypothetical protein
MAEKREPGQQSGFRWWRDLPSWLQALTGALGLLILVAGGGGAAVALHSHGPASRPESSTGPSVRPSNRQSSGPTSVERSTASVWNGPISISYAGNGIDFDSRPPASGSSNLVFNGSILYNSASNNSFQITTWTKSFTPNRDQCNTSLQNHPSSQQPAETGTGYCVLTGQSHTAYLQVTNINSDVAGGTLYANVLIWNTTGPPGSSAPITNPVSVIWWRSPISISYASNGIDLDSKHPASGSNNLVFNGSILYNSASNNSFQITTWTKSFKPNRDQCNTWAQTHPSSQQPAETGAAYCIITGQGHTAYLQITNINPNVAGGTAYAKVTVWTP